MNLISVEGGVRIRYCRISQVGLVQWLIFGYETRIVVLRVYLLVDLLVNRVIETISEQMLLSEIHTALLIENAQWTNVVVMQLFGMC